MSDLKKSSRAGDEKAWEKLAKLLARNRIRWRAAIVEVPQRIKDEKKQKKIQQCYQLFCQLGFRILTESTKPKLRMIDKEKAICT